MRLSPLFSSTSDRSSPFWLSTATVSEPAVFLILLFIHESHPSFLSARGGFAGRARGYRRFLLTLYFTLFFHNFNRKLRFLNNFIPQAAILRTTTKHFQKGVVAFMLHQMLLSRLIAAASALIFSVLSFVAPPRRGRGTVVRVGLCFGETAKRSVTVRASGGFTLGRAEETAGRRC